MVSWLHCCGSVVRHNIVVQEYEKEQFLTSWQPGSRGRTPMPALMAFSFASMQVPSLLNGAAHIGGKSSPLFNHLWKWPHRHIQKCTLHVSQAFLNPKLTIKINHHQLIPCQLTPNHISLHHTRSPNKDKNKIISPPKMISVSCTQLKMY
jgi:hypothetical protein